MLAFGFKEFFWLFEVEGPKANIQKLPQKPKQTGPLTHNFS